MGSKGSSSNSATRSQAALATQLAQETEPLRRGLLSSYASQFGIQPVTSDPAINNQLSEGQRFKEMTGKNPTASPMQQYEIPSGGLTYNPAGSPVYTAGRDVLDSQFKNAKDEIIANTAPGGALLDRLAGNEEQRAVALGNLAAGVTESELNRAIQLATGVTSSAQSGFGSAAAAQAQNAQAQAQEKAGVGQAAGTALALYATKGSAASDERVKENLERIGTADNGIPIYLGNYLGSNKKQLFILAQEVEDDYPDAIEDFHGFKLVDYGAISWRE